MFDDTHIVLQKFANLLKKLCGVQKIYMKLGGKVDVRIKKCFPTFFSGMYSKNVAKGTDNCKNGGFSMVKELENVADFDCPKFGKPVVPEAYEGL